MVLFETCSHVISEKTQMLEVHFIMVLKAACSNLPAVLSWVIFVDAKMTYHLVSALLLVVLSRIWNRACENYQRYLQLTSSLSPD